jgi:transcription initiation factor TFIID subunit 12
VSSPFDLFTMSGSPGKSLEMMQKKLQQQQQLQGAPVQQQQQGGTPPATQQPAPAPAVAPQGSPGSKPKGKDFGAMAARVRGSPVAGQPPQQQQYPTSTIPAPSPPSKPKGKDFSAMASRMGAPPPQVPPQQQQQQQQQQQMQQQLQPVDAASRAARMQAEARAAAGLPPLERPTATTVTVPLPPNIPIYPGYPIDVPQPGGSTRGASSAGQPKPTKRSSTTQRRPSKSSAPKSQSAALSAKKAAEVKARSKPTPTPGVAEGRVSLPLSAAQLAAAAKVPHAAPLVGPRIRDLVKELDPSYTIDAQAEEQVLQLADDFMDKVCRQSVKLAIHRGSKQLDVQDVQMVLAKQWGIVVPGLGPPVLKKPKAAARSQPTKRKSTSSAGGSNKATKSKATDTAPTAGTGT